MKFTIFLCPIFNPFINQNPIIMKKVMFLLCAAAFLAVACDKEEPAPTPENPANPSDTTQTEYPPTADVIYNAVTDYDGNSYDAVRIGSQVWMASNLRTTHYANGEAIPDGGENSSATAPYRYQSTGTTDLSSYGYLYNWPAVMHGASSSSTNPSGVQGICPNGWHVPSDAEWSQLHGYVESHSEYVCSGDYNIAKALAADHGWQITADNECAVGYDQSSNNATGFSALPAGGCNGSYLNFGSVAYFWSATERNDYEAYYRSLVYLNAHVGWNIGSKSYGLSVRCLRD